MEQELVFVYVEDDIHSRTVMKLLLLDELAYQYVTILEDSANFIETVESLRPVPNIFLLDIHVKPYSGFEMLAMLRQHPDFQDAIVVALTASVMSSEVQTLKEAGFDGIFPKPIVPDLFPGTLERLLRGEKVWRIS